MDGGPSIEAALALGQLLAKHVEPHDLTGQWMAHHLAQLIEDAKDEAETTPEQRIQVVETILKLWGRRRDLPGKVPGWEFDTVFAALDRLEDDSPWAFSRLRNITEDVPDPGSTELPLIATAADLERLARVSVITLIAVAFEVALEGNAEWIQAAKALHTGLEDELGSVVPRIRRRLEKLRALSEDEPFEPAADERPRREPTPTTPSREDQENPMSSHNHAQRLREMAGLLGRVADALDPPTG
jgi:hypothetical protein